MAAPDLRSPIAPKAAYATAFDHALPAVVPGSLRRAATMIGDVFLALGIGLAIPLTILALGMPVVLAVQALLWIVGKL